MLNREIYKDKQAPAVVLLLVASKEYGMDVLDWEPELVREQIEKDHSITLPTINHDKLHAAITILTTESFEDDWRVFETCCMLFTNTIVDHDEINELEAEDLIVGIAEASLIKQCGLEDKEKIIYGDEVRAYAGLVFHNYGMHKPPKLFPQAIMPESVKSDDKDKNEALQQIFDAHVDYIIGYTDKID
jgi:hypothetical protein